MFDKLCWAVTNAFVCLLQNAQSRIRALVYQGQQQQQQQGVPPQQNGGGPPVNGAPPQRRRTPPQREPAI